MQIEQFVMAYEAEQDRLRALLPEGFVSLRPVLRINAEIRNGNEGYVEFNTPVERSKRLVEYRFLERSSFCKTGEHNGISDGFSENAVHRYRYRRGLSGRKG